MDHVGHSQQLNQLNLIGLSKQDHYGIFQNNKSLIVPLIHLIVVEQVDVLVVLHKLLMKVL